MVRAVGAAWAAGLPCIGLARVLWFDKDVASRVKHHGGTVEDARKHVRKHMLWLGTTAVVVPLFGVAYLGCRTTYHVLKRLESRLA
jgi:hypothetical protein